MYNTSNIDITLINIPQSIWTWTESTDLNLPCQYLWILPFTTVFKCILDIFDNLVSQFQVFPWYTLIFIYHSNKTFNFQYLLDPFLWLKVNSMIRLNIVILLWLFLLDSLSVVLKVDSIPSVLFLVSFVLRFLLFFFTIFAYILKITTIVIDDFFTVEFGRSWLFCWFLYKLLLIIWVMTWGFNKLAIFEIDSSFLRISTSNEGGFDLSFNFVFFFLDWVFGEETIRFDEEHINLSLVEDTWFGNGENHFFVIARLEGRLEGS